jgi:serine/tyrosine/threonine adenylyltransferase
MCGWRLEHTYAELPQLFYAQAMPTAVREPRLVVLNRPLATELGLDAEALDSQEGAAIFAGNALPDGARPIAQAYAGHQYGHFTILGDGRAILLGEQIAPSGARFDIQLKGAGQTRFSRRGDGRAALGPMLRELIISEAMHALGMPTTRSLAVATTGEPVFRETMLQGAVLTRVAASHIRVGTMQWAAAHNDRDALRALADYTRARHYPHVAGGPGQGGGPEPESYLALFEAILERQASLIARWQLVGFIHGVMNTDNMALSGETIDYGPCAFMDAYDPATVFSSIDHGGRYAYGNQPPIAHWNLARLAEAMLPLFDGGFDGDGDAEKAVERATAVLDRFPERCEREWLDGMRSKLGLFTQESDDKTLVGDLLAWMHKRSADFTNTFRSLTSVANANANVNANANAHATANASAAANATVDSADAEFEAWRQRLDARRARQPQPPAEVEALMRRTNPAFIPRNHKVEEALLAATQGHDLSVMEQLLDVLTSPFDHGRDLPAFSSPGPEQRSYRTFCGT